LKRPENPASPPLPRLEPGIVPLIDGPTADGGKFDVKQWRGKVVLVAYWGSWCPFSRRELAPVLDAYNRYHADGFEVVGVSCEVSRDVLFDYTAEHRFNFPQLYFDEDGLRGAENPLFQRYGVKAVPTFVLLDREGRIVKETSRASDVEIGVAEMLGKVPSAAARKHSDSATTQHVSQAVVSDKPLDLTPVQDEPTEDGFPPQ
jgi:peroxiredoxin